MAFERLQLLWSNSASFFITVWSSGFLCCLVFGVLFFKQMWGFWIPSHAKRRAPTDFIHDRHLYSPYLCPAHTHSRTSTEPPTATHSSSATALSSNKAGSCSWEYFSFQALPRGRVCCFVCGLGFVFACCGFVLFIPLHCYHCFQQKHN